jgi:mycoredoxin
MEVVKVYGRDTCEDTQHTLAYLDSIGLKHEYVDVDEDAEGLEFIQRSNNGKERTPTIDVGGEILVEPSDTELEAVLREKALV